MKKALVILIITLISINVYSQNERDAAIEVLIALEQYETIIKDYADNNSNEYSAKSLYNIGFSYYMLEDDENCLKYMDLAIVKDSIMPAPYFIKASTYNYMGKLEEAIPYFYKAISLETDNKKLAHSHESLGYSFYHLNKEDLALEIYTKAIGYDSTLSTPYIMIAQIYSKQGKDDKALESYYKGKNNISKELQSYITILFNIGLFEQLKGSYDKAETAYKELIEIAPTDYHTYAKLIQVYYHNKEYDKAIPLKQVLYLAHKDGIIKDENLSDMFCVDQFTHNGKQIRVFERYQEGDSKNIYNKILFYILKDDGEIDFRIQTEYSPAAVALGEGKYMLCANKDDAHLNYGMIFDDNSSYETIKKAVISILDGKE